MTDKIPCAQDGSAAVHTRYRVVILPLLVITLALVLSVCVWFLRREPYVYEGQLLPRPSAEAVRAAVRKADVSDNVNEDDAYVLCEFILRIPGAGQPASIHAHPENKHVATWTTSEWAYYFERRGGRWRVKVVQQLVA